MNPKKLFLLLLIQGSTSFTFFMAQTSTILFHKQHQQKVAITYNNQESHQAAQLLFSYLEKSLPDTFEIQNNPSTTDVVQIALEIRKKNRELKEAEFIIKSENQTLFIVAQNEKALKYGVYTLLELWEFRKFSQNVDYIPKPGEFTFPKKFYKKYSPAFDYRYLLYPDCYDPSFREWHKLDWHQDDFGLWGHTFDYLVPPKKHFKNNPNLYALYEGKRRPESLCMTNDTVIKMVSDALKKAKEEKPNARFFSISQNDDLIYCECPQCAEINKKQGGPQGSLYSFLNKIAKKNSEIQICTFAYLHTYHPPIDLKIEPNITTLFCLIEMNRGLPISFENQNKAIANTLKKWQNGNKNLWVWDYTVQFTNYLSPFPNFSYFKENYNTFHKNKVKGMFVQGYADVPGDFSELRQYLLAKLLWDTTIDMEATIADFLRGYYGKAANSIQKYLSLLTENQKKSKAYLDIYSGPVQNKTTYLTPEAMDQYDQILEKASAEAAYDETIKKRVAKLKLALEYVYFEQAKFYGAEVRGLFETDKNGKKTVKKGLTESVLEFTEQCKKIGIYELSEDGLAPDTYFQDWLQISKNTTQHLGEKMTVTLITPPANDYINKDAKGLTNGIKGHNDFNISWIGWYGTNPEIEINPHDIAFNKIKMSFLEDQRHWIFSPISVSIFGFKDNQWELIETKNGAHLTENYPISIKNWEFFNAAFCTFQKIKIIVKNQDRIPEWRYRKHKKPMVMLDEIELFNN